VLVLLGNLEDTSTRAQVVPCGLELIHMCLPKDIWHDFNENVTVECMGSPVDVYFRHQLQRSVFLPATLVTPYLQKYHKFISDMPCCSILFLHSNNSVSQNQKKHMGILLQLLEKHSAFLYEIRFQNATNSEQFHAHRIMVIVLFNIYQYR